MNKVYIYKGSKLGFEKFLKKELGETQYTLFLKEIYKSDNNRSINMSLQIAGDKTEKEIEERIKVARNALKRSDEETDVVIFSDDYSGIREHVFYNLATHIAHLNIANLYIHNPPIFLEKNLEISFKDKIELEGDEYKNLTEQKFLKFINLVNDNILGQEHALRELEDHIAYSLVGEEDAKPGKPIIILLYGDSGVGKTQTAKFLAQALGGEPFRKQMSMFQSTESQRYLFGGSHSEKSFAKDLVARETNVVLLDEFDKVHPIFHNAFYQFFDEGIYTDTNYSVEIDDAIIICTSNYKDRSQIKSTLGEAIYSRFDAVIKYSSLDSSILREIINNQIDVEYELLGTKQKKEINKSEITKFFTEKRDNELKASIKNARNAINIVQYYVGKRIADLVKKI